jgi:formylglycine-generating enzyme required for sulfatase activity
MVVIPGGNFWMGLPSEPDPTSPEVEPDPFSNEQPKKKSDSKFKVVGSADERPQRQVQIRPFALGRYEVTQEQWYEVMGKNPSANKGRPLPVEQVSWNDVQEFISKLNQVTGRKYRLPSEAEWEYAAKAGINALSATQSNESRLSEFAWHSGNSGGTTHPVGQKTANAFGLFDMYGNVAEWTQDCWHDNYFGAPIDGSAWVTGCSKNHRVLRGGSVGSVPDGLRTTYRNWYYPDMRSDTNGFRVARDIE